jgi:tetratricopeptide (TPR) repeat protein
MTNNTELLIENACAYPAACMLAMLLARVADAQDWKNFGKYYLRYFDTAVARSEYPINNISYTLFERVTDPAVLEAAIKAEKYSMETLTKDDATEIDTYANLLYKAGRNREAIEWEEKAVRLSAGRDREITDHLAAMKAGQATWPGS